MKKDLWLYSDSFLKRAFAIWGYYTVASMIIAAAFMVLAFLFMLPFSVGLAPQVDVDPDFRMDEQVEAPM